MHNTRIGSGCPFLRFQVRGSPHSHTASRQTVFYTPSTITISEGEKINGTLACAPNARNNRDLDITIGYTAGGQTTKVEYKMCVLPSDVTLPGM